MQRKGSAYERTISVMLSKWWTNNERDDIFWRSSASGARATMRKKGGKSTANSVGDIMALDPIGQPLLDTFTIEVKRGYSDELVLIDLIDKPNKKNNKIILWWDKLLLECRENSTRPMLIFRRDRAQACVGLDYSLLSILYDDVGGEVPFNLSFSKIDLPVIMRLEEFLAWIPPTAIQRSNHVYG